MRRFALTSSLATAAALVLWVTLPPSARAPVAQPEAASDVRTKGQGLRAALYVKRANEVFRYELGTRLLGGDHLRLAIEDARAGYLSVLGKDEHGNVSVYYDGLQTSPGRFLVPDSLILDEHSSAETWLVVLAEQPRSSAQYAADWRRGVLPKQNYALFALRWDAR